MGFWTSLTRAPKAFLLLHQARRYGHAEIDNAVNVAAMALLGVVNEAIDEAEAIPKSVKTAVKLVVAGPILALTLKL